MASKDGYNKKNIILIIIVIVYITIIIAVIVIVMATFIRIVITIAFNGSNVSVFCQRPLSQFGLVK